MRIVPKMRETDSPRWPAVAGLRLRKRPVRLSGDAHLYRRIIGMIHQRPDVRRQRIDSVRQKLHSGRYEIDSRHLVELILEAAKDTRRDYRAAA